MSNLVEHARKELTLLGEDEDYIDSICQMVQVFSDMGHSGGSAACTIPVINRLLQFQNLTELTDDPEEWNHIPAAVAGVPEGIWQNNRNSAAFSDDGGTWYYLLYEGGANNNRVLHRSKAHKPY